MQPIAARWRNRAKCSYRPLQRAKCSYRPPQRAKCLYRRTLDCPRLTTRSHAMLLFPSICTQNVVCTSRDMVAMWLVWIHFALVTIATMPPVVHNLLFHPTLIFARKIGWTKISNVFKIIIEIYTVNLIKINSNRSFNKNPNFYQNSNFNRKFNQNWNSNRNFNSNSNLNQNQNFHQGQNFNWGSNFYKNPYFNQKLNYNASSNQNSNQNPNFN